MRYEAKTSSRCDADKAQREAIRLCQAIDRGSNATLTLKNFLTLEPIGETSDGKTVIEFTCGERQFRVNASMGK